MRKAPRFPRWMLIGILTGYLFLATAIAASLAGISSKLGSASSDQSAAIYYALLSSFWEAGVCSYLMLRSFWYGWRLLFAFMLAFFGTLSLLPQIETLVFLPEQLPPGIVWNILLMGAFRTVLFVPVALFVLRKVYRDDTPPARKMKVAIPVMEWAWKLVTIAIAYVVIYFVFGYFVAFRQHAVQVYYHGTDPGSFLRQIVATWKTTPWLFPLQAFRALLWTFLSLPLLRSLRGAPVQTGLAVALLFSMMSAQLLLPNPFMPALVRYIHLVETLPSNMLFGFLVGWILSRRFTHSPERRYAYASAA